MKGFLTKFPLFEKSSDLFLTEIALNLELRIYLPYDYIFY